MQKVISFKMQAHILLKNKSRSKLRSLASILACAMLALLFQNCKNSNNDSTLSYNYEQPNNEKKLIKSDDYRYSDTVCAGGHLYQYVIERHPADSLPIVTDDDGFSYADNYATLTIRRNDNQIFCRTFYKNSFRSFLPSDFIGSSVLDGMAFERPDGANLRFVASVSNPGTDLFVPLLITIDPNGNFTVEKSDELDSAPPDSATAADERP